MILKYLHLFLTQLLQAEIKSYSFRYHYKVLWGK